MRAWRLLVLVPLVLVFASRPAAAWGFEVHRLVTARAIAMLPDGLRPYFEAHAPFVTEHSIDPDLWRNAGFEEESARHFVDLDAYGTYPFEKLPRDRDLAVQQYGKEFVEKNGTLPWRAEEMYQKLVKAFRDHRDGRSRWALDNAQFFAAALAHYVADAHVPLHAVLNYDGQLTGQHGVHARFESDLYARFKSRLTIAPAPMPPATSARDLVFETLLDSFKAAEVVFAADKAAIGDGLEYDDAYYERFFEGTHGVLEQRISRSASAVAAAIAGAWEAAGRPDVVTERLRTTRRRRPAAE
ncbi:MAG: zinc dependent phospholipase C family protein [Vicinamibacteraceae bacterium]|nr:zinc dependent phospholipase C family protein [Vicinamibacteraceae bacterium]